jgi:catechol 2,3-dioxygenase-like lactoylglutathione lyase family enzyme
MTTPFRTLHHICVVVHDIDRATAYYESLGIGPWQEYPPLSGYTHRQVPDDEAFVAMRYRFANLDNVQLQLCQPPERDCPQRRHLDAKGEGVFHVGFECPLPEAREQAAALGLEVLMRGERDNGTGFVYFDTEPDAGYVLMCRQSTPAP